ncbi:MAG: thiamine phosphate synthase [Betaproteobacteria bacterium]
MDVDVAARAGRTALDLAAACLEGGARLLQLRSKLLAGGTFLEIAAAVVARARGAGATVVINDRADVARLAHADGVHVGQDDLGPAAVRRVLGADAIVGRSTHTSEQMARALGEPISYLAIGPVFATATKATGYAPVGLEGVARAAAAARARGVPVVAIGGITLDRAPEVLAAGAASVAVITDLLTGGDPSARVRAYLDRLSAPKTV